MTRSAINKAIAISGGLTCLTGMFLLIHYASHFSKAVHQIAGLAFMIFSIYHIKVNFKGVRNSFSGQAAKYILFSILLGCTITAAIMGDFSSH
jgi:hypothetical protein